MSTERMPLQHLRLGHELPFQRVLRRLHLLRGDERDVRRQGLVVAAIAWIPLVLLGLLSWALRGRPPSLLLDVAVHVRALVAIPLFLFAGEALDRSWDTSFRVLAEDGFLDDLKPLDRIARRAERWGRSPALELELALAALLLGQLLLWVWHATGPLAPAAGAPASGPAFVWYAVVTLPLMFFFGLRVLARWLVWSRVLWRVSRLPLRTHPAHADQAGGLGFLARPTDGLALFALGVGATASASVATVVLAGRARATDFIGTFVVLGAVVLVVGLGPLFSFAATLRRTARRDALPYQRLMTDYSRRFKRRWLDAPPGPDLLGAPDIQSFADLSNIVRSTVTTRLVPFGRFEVVELLVAVVLPVVPLVFTVLPMSELLLRLARLVVGGALGG